MNTTEQFTAEQIQKTKFMNGVYNPSEAWDIVSSIIDGHINFHKLQFQTHWEANHATSTDFRDNKIDELLKKKDELITLIQLSKQEGFNISINGTFEVELVK